MKAILSSRLEKTHIYNYISNSALSSLMKGYYKSSLFGGRDILLRLVAMMWFDIVCWSSSCGSTYYFIEVRSELSLFVSTDVSGLLVFVFVVLGDEVRSELSLLSLTDVSGLLVIEYVFPVSEVRSELS